MQGETSPFHLYLYMWVCKSTSLDLTSTDLDQGELRGSLVSAAHGDSVERCYKWRRGFRQQSARVWMNFTPFSLNANKCGEPISLLLRSFEAEDNAFSRRRGIGNSFADVGAGGCGGSGRSVAKEGIEGGRGAGESMSGCLSEGTEIDSAALFG